MTRDMTQEGGRAIYDERTCEPNLRKFRMGCAAFALLATAAAGAIGYELVTHDDTEQQDNTENVDTMSPEAQDAGFMPEPAHYLAGILDDLEYQSRLTDAQNAADRVFFDGSPETVAACHDAVARLEEVSAGSVLGIDCTP